MNWAPRVATALDIPAIEALIPPSVLELQAPYYPLEQREVAIGDVFAVDRQLIDDGTYFVVEAEGQVVAGGGWSRRRSLCGGDRRRNGDEGVLDPRTDPARIRAFFVHPRWARRGLGRALLRECERAIRAAGFRAATLSATLAGEPLYAAEGFTVTARTELALERGAPLPVVTMDKDLGGPVEAPEQDRA